jgi:hypothetical protein
MILATTVEKEGGVYGSINSLPLSNTNTNSAVSDCYAITRVILYFFLYFFGRLECVDHFFAYVGHFVFLRDV